MDASSAPQPINERDMVERAQHDPQAFPPLYRLYLPRVYGYIAYRVGNKQDAEDLTAEVFMKVVQALPSFEYRGDGAFAAWIFRIAHNQIAVHYRQQQTRVIDSSLDDLPEIRSKSPSPDQSLQQKERFARLRQIITTLSPRRQEIVTLRFFGELKNKEIAVVLGIDERTVASHLSRAIEDLGRRYDYEKEEQAL